MRDVWPRKFRVPKKDHSFDSHPCWVIALDFQALPPRRVNLYYVGLYGII